MAKNRERLTFNYIYIYFVNILKSNQFLLIRFDIVILEIMTMLIIFHICKTVAMLTKGGNISGAKDY